MDKNLHNNIIGGTKMKKKNVTKYGEVVCSEFEWLPIEKQKENADKLANITKKNNKEKNK